MDQSGTCWFWQLGCDKRGYGRFGIWTQSLNRDGVLVIRNRGVLAHRMAWTLEHGLIPAGLGVLHRCNTPPCVNPAHLYLGTQLANNQQAVRDRRNAVTLKRTDPPRIRKYWSLGLSGRGLARLFGVSKSTISFIVKGKRWGYGGVPVVRDLEALRLAHGF